MHNVFFYYVPAHIKYSIINFSNVQALQTINKSIKFRKSGSCA